MKINKAKIISSRINKKINNQCNFSLEPKFSQPRRNKAEKSSSGLKLSFLGKAKALKKNSPFLIIQIILIILVVSFSFTNCRRNSGSKLSSSPAMTGKTQPELAGEQKKTTYHCPMHPNYISDKPGECPICGMTLVPVEKEKTKGTMARAEGAIEISPEKQQLIGITFGQVDRRELHLLISAYARFTYDETRLASITTKFSGWVEELFVDYTGKLVRRGEPLFSIFSPELIAAQEEYLLALRAEKTFGSNKSGSVSSNPEGRQENGEEGSQSRASDSTVNLNNVQGALSSRPGLKEPVQNIGDLAAAAKRRLLLWDITEEQIRKLEEEGRSFRTLTIFSPVSGFIIEKNVVQGKFVMAGETLLSIADLSRIWLLADVYEKDLSFIAVNKEVEVEITSFPGERFRGRVSYIFPFLEKESRTVKVRMEFPNPDYRLKPEMYGRVKIHLRLGNRLSIPAEAVIDTGERKVVFVANGTGHFEPREVNVGLKAGDFYEVLDGLEEGERVVTSAQFLVDSESRLKAAIKGWHLHPSEKKPETEEKQKLAPPPKHIHQ